MGGGGAPPPHDRALAAFPTPGARPVVLEVPMAMWMELSGTQVEALEAIGDPSAPGQSPWDFYGAVAFTSPLPTEQATRVGQLLASWGYRCDERDAAARRGGVEVDLWRVGRAGERKGAAV